MDFDDAEATVKAALANEIVTEDSAALKFVDDHGLAHRAPRIPETESGLRNASMRSECHRG